MKSDSSVAATCCLITMLSAPHAQAGTSVPSPRQSTFTGCSSLSTPKGFPCCARFPGVHAAATTPAQQLGASSARFPSRISLPGKGDPVGPRIDLFEVYTAFNSHCGLHTRWFTQGDPLHRRLQPFRYLHDCSDYFRLEHLPGGIRTHWKAPPFHGASPKRSVTNVRL
jgi:hypothetical protein